MPRSEGPLLENHGPWPGSRLAPGVDTVPVGRQCLDDGAAPEPVGNW